MRLRFGFGAKLDFIPFGIVLFNSLQMKFFFFLTRIEIKSVMNIKNKDKQRKTKEIAIKINKMNKVIKTKN